MIYELLTLLHLMVGPTGPQAHPVASAPVSERIIGIYNLSQVQNLHLGSLTCGVIITVVGRTKCHLIILYRKQGCMWSGAGNRASITDQEDTGVVIPVILPCFSPSFPIISPIRIENGGLR